MTTETFNCGNCDFWRHNPALQPKTSTPFVDVGKVNGRGEVVAIRAGECWLNPPQMVMIPIPSRIQPGAMEMSQQRVQPFTQETECCGQHPARRAVEARRLAVFDHQVAQGLLNYRPGQNHDSIASGFSRVPSFTEAGEYNPGVKSDDRVSVEVIGDLSGQQHDTEARLIWAREKHTKLFTEWLKNAVAGEQFSLTVDDVLAGKFK